LLSDGEPADRVFGVIADELSFVHDYYNSSLPISYSKSWLPVLGIIISLFSISYCIVLAVDNNTYTCNLDRVLSPLF
jgi:ABC-type transport system involved in cytochrome bd biosynthesis fused ATPase/permease subunit